MSHVRKQLRDKVRLALAGVSGGGALGVNRARPWPKDASPSLGVRTPQENSTDTDMNGGQARVIRLMVDISDKAKTEVELSDALDAVALEVEVAIFAAGSFGALAQMVSYRGATLMIDGGAEKLAGTMSLAFDVTVYTEEMHPETAL